MLVQCESAGVLVQCENAGVLVQCESAGVLVQCESAGVLVQRVQRCWHAHVVCVCAARDSLCVQSAPK